MNKGCAPPPESARPWLKSAAAASVTFLQAATGAMLRMGRSADAVSMLLRWAQTADASGLANSAAKAYLGAVVVWLHAGDAAQAGAVYQVRTPPACRFCRPQEGRANAWLHAGGLFSPRPGGWACMVRPDALL